MKHSAIFAICVAGALLLTLLMVACEPVVVPPSDQRAVEAPRIMRAANVAPEVLVEDSEGYEGDGRAVVHVWLSEASDTLTNLRYSTRPGTAVPYEDYWPVTGSAPISAGETRGTIVVPISLDHDADDGETFTVVVGDAEGTVTIRDGYDPDPPGPLPGGGGGGASTDSGGAPSGPSGPPKFWGRGGVPDDCCGCSCGPQGCAWRTRDNGGTTCSTGETVPGLCGCGYGRGGWWGRWGC